MKMIPNKGGVGEVHDFRVGFKGLGSHGPIRIALSSVKNQTTEVVRVTVKTGLWRSCESGRSIVDSGLIDLVKG